jgi:hypothetical protein
MTAVLLGASSVVLQPTLSAKASSPTVLDCYQPESFYEYGATDANAEVGNSSTTAVFDASGTLTVLRSLAANEDNQVNLFASGYDSQTGRALPSEPNQGAFIGIRYVIGNTPSFAWLKDWPATQTYVQETSPVVLTSYAGPNGISVTDEAFATAGPLSKLDTALPSGGADALVQGLTVRLAATSPARDISLVAYGNWDPVATQIPYVPLADSGCTADLNLLRQATFDQSDDATVASWSGIDISTGEPASSAVAVGWSGGTYAWQVGGDSTDPATPLGDPEDAFQQLSSAPYELGDASSSYGPTTAAIMAKVDVVAGQSASMRLLTTVASTAGGALDQLGDARRASFSAQVDEVERSWDLLLSRAPIPTTSDAAIVSTAHRALITALPAIDPASGAIIASPDTQGPYEEDWVRDGSFIDAMLDENGYTELVTRHELFYARSQSSPENLVLTAPFGNWPMAMYPSGGGPGGPIPYEIDETGYGAWTLYDHSTYLPPAQAKSYVSEVFPAIARAADWLTICEDPLNGLQCPASEDDNYVPSQTLHGALPALLGLRSAVAAAAGLGVTGAEVAAWRSRAATLAAAIGKLYDPTQHAYRESSSAAAALPVSYEDGGLMLWPAQLLPYSSPEMVGEMQATLSAMEASFTASSGSYEGVALLGACRAESAGAGLGTAERQELGHALDQFLKTTATATGLFGEEWQRWGDGSVGPVNDMPHTWESALFDMSALCIYPPR